MPLEAYRYLMHEMATAAAGPGAGGKTQTLILCLIGNREICLASKRVVQGSARVPRTVTGRLQTVHARERRVHRVGIIHGPLPCPCKLAICGHSRLVSAGPSRNSASTVYSV